MISAYIDMFFSKKQTSCDFLRETLEILICFFLMLLINLEKLYPAIIPAVFINNIKDTIDNLYYVAIIGENFSLICWEILFAFL